MKRTLDKLKTVLDGSMNNNLRQISIISPKGMFVKGLTMPKEAIKYLSGSSKVVDMRLTNAAEFSTVYSLVVNG